MTTENQAAEQAPAVEAQAQPNLVFTVDMNEANVLIAGLAELPAKMSMGLIRKLQEQAAVQLNPQPEA